MKMITATDSIKAKFYKFCPNPSLEHLESQLALFTETVKLSNAETQGFYYENRQVCNESFRDFGNGKFDITQAVLLGIDVVIYNKVEKELRD